MNKEFKLRIWDKTEKRWSSTIPKMISLDGITWEFCGSQYERDNLSIQLFTGLKDKDGVDVFDGDVLLYDSSPYPCVVRWSTPDDDFHPGFRTNDIYGQYGPFVIIGNIFDNPELI